MKKSRIVGIICLLLFALGFVAACNRGNDTDTGNQPQAGAPATPTPAPQQQEPTTPDVTSILNPIGTLPIVNDPVTLSVMTSIRTGQDMETNLAATEISYRTGVNIDWVQVPEPDFGTRLSLMLATNEYPEIITRWGNVGDFAMIYFYAQMGIFRSISDFIDPYMPNLQLFFEMYPQIHADMFMPDGQIYGVPNVDDCFHCTMSQKLWIYTPWLDALGLDMPETTDELLYVLRAFRDRNPTGTDTPAIPFLGNTGWRNSPEALLTSWITTDEGSRLQVRNNTVIPVFNTDEWRDGLRFLRLLNDEGLLDSESFVIDRPGQALIGNRPDYNIVGVKPGLWIGATVLVDIEDQEGRWNNWRMIPPLMGPNGHREAQYSPLVGNHRAVVTDRLSDELMPVALRWLDNFLDTEFTLMAYRGIENVTWRWAEPGEVGIHGGPASWARVFGIDDGPNVMIGQMFPMFRTHDFRLSEVANRDIVEQESLLYDMSLIQLPFRQPLENVVPVLMFDEHTSVELVDLRTTINSFVTENIARFTVGDLDIETDWDWYINELQAMGLDRYMQIMNEGLAARNARGN